MQFEADIIRLLQHLSNDFTDALNIGVTQLGTEIAFMAVAVVLYWCVDKRFAYRFFNVYILGVAMTNFLKLGFKRERPFNAYPEKVRYIGTPETTYSFPSGHTESIASISTLLTIKYGKKYTAVPVVCAILTALVMLSRMYLGQHYLSDVLCGLTAGVFFAIAFNALLALFGDKEEWFIIPGIVLTVVLISVLAGTGSLNCPSGVDILKGVGAFVAFDAGYIIEKKFVKYDVAANRVWWKVALRLVIGLGVAIALQQGLKPILPKNISMLYCFLRYFLLAAWAAVAAPALFKAIKI